MLLGGVGHGARVVFVTFLFMEVKVIVAGVVPGSGGGWWWWWWLVYYVVLIVVAMIRTHFVVVLIGIIVECVIFGTAMFTIIVVHVA